jgi:hypothetical protein
VCKNSQTHGFTCEFSFYHTDEDGQRKAKVQTFDSALHKTERDGQWLETLLS